MDRQQRQSLSEDGMRGAVMVQVGKKAQGDDERNHCYLGVALSAGQAPVPPPLHQRIPQRMWYWDE